jgi:curved DNA-binding protein CbpA
MTNSNHIKRNDPFAQLGLSWGATTTEIKQAYKQKAREFHPDVNPNDPNALRKFQAIQEAYNRLMKNKLNDDAIEEWSFNVWRTGDVIAQERTDVAGEMRKRPAKPAASKNRAAWGVAALGHPSGGGVRIKRGEYLGDGKAPPRSSTVGTGQSKWVKRREFQPWNPEESERKRASSKPTKLTTRMNGS